MSGIAGLIQLDGKPVETQCLTRMLAPLHTRGADRQAMHCAGTAGFAHALLATTREAVAERQPWVHPESGCVVVSDSRLDNRPQLLRELGITRPADEVGDGELLHAAWQRWGEGCADRLRGDFAFALWNPRAEDLFIARDPMGVRPILFHHCRGQRFVFASSTEALLAEGNVPTDIDEGRIADALIGETEGIDAVCTFYTAVQRLPPAHWMRLRNGTLNQQRYWRPVAEVRPTGLPRSEPEWIEAQREQLDRAVRLRLRSHRPVGSMLSGGLDSSSVVALASIARAEQGEAAFPIFSATNSADAECAETRHIRAVAEHVRCDPTFIDLHEFERPNDLAKAWWDSMGEPFDGGMSLVASLYQAAAAKGVISLMDGIPADNLYVTGRHAKHLFDQGQWRGAWRAALAQWQLHGVRFPYLNAARVMAGCLMPNTVHALREHLTARREYQQMRRESLIHREFAARVDLWQRYRRYHRTIGGSHQWHPLEEALSSMAAPYITAGVERYNRVASLFGIEPRLPFADRELIEFHAWLPVALRTREGHPKWVLRQAMLKDLPTDVIWRRDKSHVGWRFNRAVLASSPSTVSQSSQLCTAWLDSERLQTGSQRPASVASEGMLKAEHVSRWSHARQPA